MPVRPTDTLAWRLLAMGGTTVVVGTLLAFYSSWTGSFVQECGDLSDAEIVSLEAMHRSRFFLGLAILGGGAVLTTLAVGAGVMANSKGRRLAEQ